MHAGWARRSAAINTYVKDEGLNVTASFKARGLAMAVSRAVELGAKELAIPSAGNAACAMSAYAAAAGLPAHVFMPADVPSLFQVECRELGARVNLVNGLINDCGVKVREGVAEHGWFDVSTLREPYRIEGKKTMGYEIAEQLGWTLPDVIIYPTGGGTGLVGMWKAFDEMEQMGLIGPQRPRMVSVQSTGCAPIVRAFEQGVEFAELWQGAKTVADGLRVPVAIGDFLILRAIRASRGVAVAVPDEEMLQLCPRDGQQDGHLSRHPRGRPAWPRRCICSSGAGSGPTRRSCCLTRAAGSSTPTCGHKRGCAERTLLQMNAIIAQCGGPTPVINATVAAVIAAWQERDSGDLYGSRHGFEGLVAADWVDLTWLNEADVRPAGAPAGRGAGRQPVSARRRRFCADDRQPACRRHRRRLSDRRQRHDGGGAAAGGRGREPRAGAAGDRDPQDDRQRPGGV